MIAIGGKDVGVGSEICVVHFEIRHSYTLSKLMIVSVHASGICCGQLDQDETMANGGISIDKTMLSPSIHDIDDVLAIFSTLAGPSYTPNPNPKRRGICQKLHACPSTKRAHATSETRNGGGLFVDVPLTL